MTQKSQYKTTSLGVTVGSFSAQWQANGTIDTLTSLSDLEEYDPGRSLVGESNYCAVY